MDSGYLEVQEAKWTVGIWRCKRQSGQWVSGGARGKVDSGYLHCKKWIVVLKNSSYLSCMMSLTPSCLHTLHH